MSRTYFAGPVRGKLVDDAQAGSAEDRAGSGEFLEQPLGRSVAGIAGGAEVAYPQDAAFQTFRPQVLIDIFGTFLLENLHFFRVPWLLPTNIRFFA